VGAAAVEKSLSGLKGEFEALEAAGRCPAETALLFRSLLALFETVLMLLVEKSTAKTPANSGLPGAASEKDETARPKARPGGRRREQPHDACGNARLEQSVEVSRVGHCGHCGHDLARIAVQGHERRTLVDVVFVTEERHVDAETRCCPACGKTTRGAFPGHLHGPLQYGAGAIALAVNLLVSQMVPLRRMARLLKSMTGSLISEATLIGWVLRLHRALEDWERAAAEKLLEMPALHVDETSIRISGRNHWIHTHTSGGLGLMLAHPKRGQAAIDAINIIPRYGGTRGKDGEEDDGEAPKPVLVHDRWASYFKYRGCDHALCGHHLQRDLQFVIDAHGHRWAGLMLKLLSKTGREVAKADTRMLDGQRYLAVRRQYRTILIQGLRELPALPERKGNRGKPPKTDAHNLHEAFRSHEDEILRFARNPFCAYTNNAAERFHRMSKVRQKVSGTFRSPEMAQAYCRVTSYLQTMSLLGYNPLTAIELARKGDAVRILEENL